MSDLTAFDQISWDMLDRNAVHVFYEAIGRPVNDRVLLIPVVECSDTWKRCCVADFKALQGRDCPTCVQ